MLALNASWCKLVVSKSAGMIDKARHGQPPTPDYQIDGRANNKSPFSSGKHVHANGHAVDGAGDSEQASNGHATSNGNAKACMQLRSKRVAAVEEH